MHIVCPHCTTSYAIDMAALGAAGRTVRCSRCKEVWLARPEDAAEVKASALATAEAGHPAANVDAAADWDALERTDDGGAQQTPVIDSPSISADWPVDGEGSSRLAGSDWPSTPRHDAQAVAARRHQAWFQKLLRPQARLRPPGKPFITLPTICAAMGALVLALVIWRVDVVRLLPQAAAFYKLVGLEVNVRGLSFKDVKITTETMDGKPVLVIEGVIVGLVPKPVELPRLRFSVRDAQGAEIYAWNALLEQAVLNPGERAWFKSRLASPPPEGRNIDVRFFSKRDIAGGNV
jgi:predicted Zn finger-like uncharacterized protein